MNIDQPLETRILLAFQDALDAGMTDVAEHLLSALEALQPTEEPAAEKITAYFCIAEQACLPRGH